MRFPGFTDGWEVKKLEKITEKIGDGLHGTPNYIDDSNFYFINGNNLVNGKIKLNVNTKKIDLETFSKNNKSLNENTLLISINGTIGNIAKYNQEKVMLGKSVGYFNFSKSADFFYFALQTNSVQDFLFSKLTGSTIKNLSLKTLRETVVSFPSTNEQQKIANFLFLIDERIQTQNKIIENLRTLIKGTIEKIFMQKLRFKDYKGSDFLNWEVKKLGDILTIGSGRDYKHLEKGDIPVFGTGGLMTYVNSFLHEGETVCIGRKGTIDKPMYYKGKIWTVDTLFYSHSFINTVPKFIFYIYKLINWKDYNEASGVPSLSKSTIEKIEINIPSLPEQNKITDFLSQIDQKIEIEKQLLTQYENQKKYLLQNLFI